ncbi:hypothetical protein SAMN06265360_12069 [Haloechinothrix alba]|uniref:Excreted virulence factor EspC, type VII ESX diderm n=1 Tax=Haloechinothrix alba TaxID=664784 RepID=A0A238ZB73_9PSEU|nr:hypothetical protein [Haloechinothrix alba]SNR80786.1 hypothetical protein SAMN06265360_12069 [Haloechinothrix alba]
METPSHDGPVRVLIVSERPELPHSLDVATLAVRELDSDQLSAVRAAGLIAQLTVQLLRWQDSLTRAHGALDEAAAASQRASVARDHLASALEHTEQLCVRLSDARDVLDCHWPRQPASLAHG